MIADGSPGAAGTFPVVAVELRLPGSLTCLLCSSLTLCSLRLHFPHAGWKLPRVSGPSYLLWN